MTLGRKVACALFLGAVVWMTLGPIGMAGADHTSRARIGSGRSAWNFDWDCEEYYEYTLFIVYIVDEEGNFFFLRYETTYYCRECHYRRTLRARLE